MHHKWKQFADLINFNLARFIVFGMGGDNFVIWMRTFQNQTGASILCINVYIWAVYSK